MRVCFGVSDRAVRSRMRLLVSLRKKQEPLTAVVVVLSTVHFDYRRLRWRWREVAVLLTLPFCDSPSVQWP